MPSEPTSSGCIVASDAVAGAARCPPIPSFREQHTHSLRDFPSRWIIPDVRSRATLAIASMSSPSDRSNLRCPVVRPARCLAPAASNPAIRRPCTAVQSTAAIVPWTSTGMLFTMDNTPETPCALSTVAADSLEPHNTLADGDLNRRTSLDGEPAEPGLVIDGPIDNAPNAVV